MKGVGTARRCMPAAISLASAGSGVPGSTSAGCPGSGLMCPSSRADQGQHLVAAALHVLVGAQRLKAEPQQWLGVGGAHVEVPVLVVDRDAVEVLLVGVGVAGFDLAH